MIGRQLRTCALRSAVGDETLPACVIGQENSLPTGPQDARLIRFTSGWLKAGVMVEMFRG